MNKIITILLLFAISFPLYSADDFDLECKAIDWCKIDNACFIKSIGSKAYLVRVTSKDGGKSVVCLEDKAIIERFNGFITYDKDGSIYISRFYEKQPFPSKEEFEEALYINEQ